MAQEKSRVNRFGIAGNYGPKQYGTRRDQVEPHFRELDTNFVVSALQGYMNHRSKSKAGKLALPSYNSYCFAYTNHQDSGGYRWFAKQGCIAAINTFGKHVLPDNTQDLYFYIPNVLPLSKGKKIKYIEELSEVLGKDRIQYIETVDPSKGLCEPSGDNPQKVYPVLTGTDSGGTPSPRVWVQCKEWLVVKCVIKAPWERLMFLQFLRPLYQYLSINSTINSNNRVLKDIYKNHLAPEACLYFIYNQPQLYFRLKRLFPTLSRIQLLYLSHTLHGRQVSQTFFIWYTWNGFYKDKIDLDSKEALNTSIGHINDYFMGKGLRHSLVGVVESRGQDIYLNDGTYAHNAIDPETDPKTFKITEMPVGGPTIMSMVANYLSENFLAKRYKNCINMLAVLSKDKKLLID